MLTRRKWLRTALWGVAGAAGVAKLEAAQPERDSLKDRPSSPFLDGVPKISAEDYLQRQERARQLMGESGIDALYLTGGTSLAYFSGVRWGRSERLFAMVLPRRGAPVFICPAFEEMRARERTGPGADIRVWQEHESPFRLVARVLADLGLRTGTVGVEETVRFFEVDGLAKAAPQLRLVSGDPVTHRCRGIKSEKEVAIMRAANRLTLDVYRTALRRIREGMTEDQVAGLIRAEFRKRGVSGGALVLHGPNAAFPHGTSKRQKLREGMVVLVDGGCSLNGYRSDVTRSFVFGKPTDRQMRVWEAVHRAQEAALQAAIPGRSCGEVDGAARHVIEKAGFGPGYRYFTHRLGHGIGMDGHEWPYLVQGNSVKLEAGMTFTNEPGIYLYGEFGIRLEDVMVITEKGAEFLTDPSPSISWPFE
jgi:Xaa-Pro dipeptidase